MRKLIPLDNIYGIYCDAWVLDDLGLLIFASLWGRDIAIQELLAKLTLSSTIDGITQLQLTNGTVLRIGDPDRLGKHTGRMPKANLFGEMVHLWLYDLAVKAPDLVNRKSYLLVSDGCKDVDTGIWQMVKQVCHLPLLESWREQIIRLCRDNGWLTIMDGKGLSAVALELPGDDFDEAMSGLIQDRQLTL